MKIRTDLASAGLFIFKYWIIKLLEGLENEHDILIQSIEVSYELIMFQDELIPFLAKHQFKTKLRKFIVKSKLEKKHDFSDHDIQ